MKIIDDQHIVECLDNPTLICTGTLAERMVFRVARELR